MPRAPRLEDLIYLPQGPIIFSFMFSSNAAFDQDIAGWNVGAAKNMADMFKQSKFNRVTVDQKTDRNDESRCRNMKQNKNKHTLRSPSVLDTVNLNAPIVWFFYVSHYHSYPPTVVHSHCIQFQPVHCAYIN